MGPLDRLPHRGSVAGINIGEEEDGDTGLGAAEDSRTTPNARRRTLQEFLHGRPSVTLAHYKEVRTGGDELRFDIDAFRGGLLFR